MGFFDRFWKGLKSGKIGQIVHKIGKIGKQLAPVYHASKSIASKAAEGADEKRRWHKVHGAFETIDPHVTTANEAYWAIDRNRKQLKRTAKQFEGLNRTVRETFGDQDEPNRQMPQSIGPVTTPMPRNNSEFSVGGIPGSGSIRSAPRTMFDRQVGNTASSIVASRSQQANRDFRNQV